MTMGKDGYNLEEHFKYCENIQENRLGMVLEYILNILGIDSRAAWMVAIGDEKMQGIWTSLKLFGYFAGNNG